MKATPRKIAALFAAALAGNPAAVVSFEAIAIDKKLKFNGRVKIDGTSYDVAGSNGKLKSFTAIDDLVKTLASYVGTADGAYPVSVQTGTLLIKAIPADMKKAAAAEVVKLGKLKASQEAVLAEIDSELALMPGWENGNPLQVARKAQTVEQRGVVSDDIAVIIDSIAAETAIANG